MKFLFPGVIVLFISITCVAQHKIEGSIFGHLHQNVTLLEYFGDTHRLIDSTQTDGNGWFSFDMDKNTPVGLYSLAFNNRPQFNFIYNDEDIIMKYEMGDTKLPEFIFSIENLIYFDYLVQSEKYDHKTAMLIDILQYYPENDSFYFFAQEHFNALQLDYRSYTNRIIEEYPHTFISHIVKSDRPIIIPEGVSWDEYRLYNQSHFLDETDFKDTILLNTNILTGKAIDYLAFYSMNNMNKDMQEHFFIQAVDSILHRAMDDDRVYNFMMQYLIEGFDRYGFDRVISHIAENYEPANSCVNEDRKSELQKRVENLRKLSIGNQAPDIEIENINGNRFNINDIDNEFIVVLFWASWCPHCEEMIPGLKSLYQDPSFTDFEILSISIDTSANDYANAIASQAAGWINYCDFNGWDTKAAIDYSIYATPTMFLIDRNRKILARPGSVSDLKIEMEKLEKK